VDTEVVIVGAGAAGGVLALELARRGIGVVVLESGPRHDVGRRREYVRRFLRHQNPWETSPRELDRQTISGDAAYRLEGRRARGVGGSTLAWEGYALRFHASDFRMRSLHGVADDWPLAYPDLELDYAAAERLLGVAGSDDDPRASPRSTPFPLPPFALSHSDARLAGACSRLGIALHRLPQARNSRPYGGRPACSACATCQVCPTGARASIDLTQVPEAEATGRAQVRTEATVLRLETDGLRRVTAAVYAERDGTRRRVTARAFVVAAGAVEAARLLLLSASGEFPAGLANGSGLVGRYFMSHPAIDVRGRAAERVGPYRIGFSTAMSRQFAVGGDRARRGAFLLEFLNSAGPTPEELAAASGVWGEALAQRVRDEFGHWLGIRAYVEPRPDRANAVSLNRRAADPFGSPGPHIHCNVGPYERQGLDEAAGVARRILTAAGCSGLLVSPRSFAAHQIGTHRMGADPRTSVVDADLRAHDLTNLYLVGSGCFVTASASPPTLTIVALAIRAARHLATDLRTSVRVGG
jgi:choline dehydrogenase-like flavoprotein